MARGMCWRCGASNREQGNDGTRKRRPRPTKGELDPGCPLAWNRNSAFSFPWSLGALFPVSLYRRRQERLAVGEFVAHHGEAKNAALEPVGEAPEERRFLLVFEQVELADNEVAFLAGMNQFGQGGMMTAAMAPGVDRLG